MPRKHVAELRNRDGWKKPFAIKEVDEVKDEKENQNTFRDFPNALKIFFHPEK
jgi:hypothetical protein